MSSHNRGRKIRRNGSTSAHISGRMRSMRDWKKFKCGHVIIWVGPESIIPGGGIVNDF